MTWCTIVCFVFFCWSLFSDYVWHCNLSHSLMADYSIVGPNGSGKSTVLDAIAFVLGEKSTRLRGKSTIPTRD
jgi:ABC-type Mn2+/Zn2+ transport system ATPase subunit